MDVLANAFSGGIFSCVAISGGKNKFFFQFFHPKGERERSGKSIGIGSVETIISSIKSKNCKLLITHTAGEPLIDALSKNEKLNVELKVASDNLAEYLGRLFCSENKSLPYLAGSEILPMYVAEDNI